MPTSHLYLFFLSPSPSQQLSPPLLPPRGEVNAADAFDIGNFDDDDTRGIKVGSGVGVIVLEVRSCAFPDFHVYTLPSAKCRDLRNVGSFWYEGGVTEERTIYH